MNYHNITMDDMRNGDGLRVVLWVSGCNHHCKGCHNPITWNPYDGVPFTDDTYKELLDLLSYDHISGLTISGGDPLYPSNIPTISEIVKVVKEKFPTKTIWIYTGNTWESICDDQDISEILRFTDVLIDGEYVEEFQDTKYRWAGSTNQRVIDVKTSLKEGEVVLYATSNAKR